MLRFSESLGQMFVSFSAFHHVTPNCQVCVVILGRAAAFAAATYRLT